MAIAVTLSGSPAIVAGSNSVQAAETFESTTGYFAGCQGNEFLPRDASAIRLSLDSALGPRVKVRVLKDKRLITSGERGAGWTAADVTIPLRPLAHAVSGVEVCFQFLAANETVGLTGEPVAGGKQSKRELGLLKVEYLQPGHSSWWSLASEVTGHMAFGHAWNGAWLIPFLAIAMGAVLAIACWLSLRLAR
ncbi:MAG TPA: hypothetical protein VGL57_00790 [Solirubrobacteraceae bacterium]